MKRFLLFTIMSLLVLTSCKSSTKFNNYNYKKIDYYVGGVYIQVNEDEKLTMDDYNPKVYFDFTGDVIMFTTSGGLYSVIGAFDKNINMNSNPVLLNARVPLALAEEEMVVTLYPIYMYKDGTKTIDVKRSTNLKLKGHSAFQYVTEFTNSDINYKVVIQLYFN